MHYRFIGIAICLVVCLMMSACSPGVYTKMDSTAPERGPVFIGMKRSNAERHLGTPLFVTRLNELQYRGIYEYEKLPGAADIISFDLMDLTTMGIGRLIVSPIDRIKGSRHLVAVVYQMEDKDINNDRVVDIKERVKVKLD